MTKHSYLYISLLATGVVFTSCEPEFDNPVEDQAITSQSSGDADFSSFVALGDSTGAGIADGALYIDGQEASYPNLIAQQMKAAAGGNFSQPLMADNVGGFSDLPGSEPGTLRFGPRLVLDLTTTPPSPTPFLGTPTTKALDLNTGNPAYNNLGVPGARIFHVNFAGYGNPMGLTTAPVTANPYYVRMASSPNATILEEAASLQPTFFSLWLGTNDLLDYATRGGVGTLSTSVNPLTDAPPTNLEITNPTYFGGLYNAVVGALTSGGAKGILTNLPDISSLPFFTTVPFNAIPMSAEEAAGANLTYAAYNQALLGALQDGEITTEEVTQRTISFQAGLNNAVVIFDENLTDLGSINPAFAMAPQIRQATADDLIVLTASRIIGTRVVENDPSTTNGVGIPLADQWVLTPEEQALVITNTNIFNTTIENIATANGLAFYDVNQRLKDLTSGVSINDAVYTSAFASGGIFSLDGIHLTPRGNAIIANEMIEEINSTYSSTLQPVDIERFGTITLK